MQSILDQKKILVKKKKAEYEANCDRRQLERIEDLQKKAEQAKMIRIMKKEAKNSRVKYFDKKYSMIKERIGKDIELEEERIKNAKKMAVELADYGLQINDELHEIEDYHRSVETEFYNFGDIVCRNPVNMVNCAPLNPALMQQKAKIDRKGSDVRETSKRTQTSMGHAQETRLVSQKVAPPEQDFAYLPDLGEDDYKGYLDSD